MPPGGQFSRAVDNPEVLQVSERTVMVTEALSTLQTLRRLFDASARSGNPVVWC